MTANRITLTVPLDAGWLTLIESTGRQFASRFDFSRNSQDLIAFSILEAGEELLRRAGETGETGEYSLSFEYQGPAILVDLRYSGKIPLNPHMTEEYEVPEASSNPDDWDMDALWLHMIKRHMDRVFFQINGGQHVLRLIKYQRSEGGERLPWSFSLSPSLKEGIRIDWDEREERLNGVLLQDMQSAKVLHFGPLEAQVIRGKAGGRKPGRKYSASC